MVTCSHMSCYGAGGGEEGGVGGGDGWGGGEGDDILNTVHMQSHELLRSKVGGGGMEEGGGGGTGMLRGRRRGRLY